VRYLIFSAVGLFTAFSTFASTPKKGDYAKEAVSAFGETLVTKTIIGDFNSIEDTYIVAKYLVQADGTEQFQSSDVVSGQEIRTEFISNLDSACAGLRGSIELVTVPAGIFRSCKVVTTYPGGQMTTWYAQDIPFGVVKSLGADSSSGLDEHELTAFGNDPQD
jgi:hypothetical protein